MTIRATYRLQFHAGFTFADARAIVPYLARLGISHVYASPITVAQPGSTHGYDVADPTRIWPDLGGEEQFHALVASLRDHGMGLIIDIVPNHMGVSAGINPWWNDVLAKGQDSEYAGYFDIDWRDKLLLPFLGEPFEAALEQGALALRMEDEWASLVAYGSSIYPIRAEDQDEVARNGVAHYDAARADGRSKLRALIDRQHYRLAWWRTANDALNWRRFFTISELAGLRIEDDAVFEAAHALYFRLYAEGLIDGLRVDHVDGLSDPAGYCRKLRERLEALRARRPAPLDAEPPYLVIEKILAEGEPLSRDWGVDGTSGYDFMEEVAALLHAPEGQEPLDRLWTQLSGRPADFPAEELQARRDMLSWEFEGQLARCVQSFAALARSAPQTSGLTAGMLRRAIERLLWVFPVYRTYGTGDSAPGSDAAIRETVRRRVQAYLAPGEGSIVDAVLAWLAGEAPGDPELAKEAVRRFQQLSAPIAAKAVEDTAFYRYGRLLSRNDVGFSPESFSIDLESFHAAMAGRREAFPRAMLATATHDHKRGEDVRARIAALSEVPGEWGENVRRWTSTNEAVCEGIHPADLYQLYQTLYGAWPNGFSSADGSARGDFGDRVFAWWEKALREAKLRSSWTEPDAAYEAQARACLVGLLDCSRSAAFLSDMEAFVARMAPAAEANGLAQALLRCTVPGVPDTYQGTELADLSLVDPDNRRPVDYALRARLLEGADHDYDSRKQRLIARTLAERRQLPALWAKGSYEPLTVEGPRSANVIAFLRREGGAALLVLASIRCGAELAAAPDSAAWWVDTSLRLPPELPGSAARDVLEGGGWPGDPQLAAHFASSPVRLYRFSR